MAWTKVDDQLHSHPKILEAWSRSRASLGLHLMALSFCGNYGTDGRVNSAFIESKIPKAPERRKVVDTLVSVGLWDRRSDGDYEIHDYLVFNRSRAEVEADREEERRKKSEAGRKGAAVRHGRSHSSGVAPAIAPASPSATPVPEPVPGESPSPVPVPVPSSTATTDGGLGTPPTGPRQIGQYVGSVVEDLKRGAA